MEDNKLEKNNEIMVNEKSIYVNSAGLQFGPFDFSFTFRNLHETQKQENSLNVVMSPQHAKAFLHSLNEMVMQFETTFGVITDKDPKQKS